MNERIPEMFQPIAELSTCFWSKFATAVIDEKRLLNNILNNILDIHKH